MQLDLGTSGIIAGAYLVVLEGEGSREILKLVVTD
jgi:hypothetical protein